PSSVHNLDTNNSMNTALDMRVPYNSRRAKQSSIDIAIAGASANSDTNSDSADNLMDIKCIKEYIHIENNLIVIDMYIFYKKRKLAILRKEIDKYKGNTVYIQYNTISISKKYIGEVMNNLLNKYSTIIVWCKKGNPHTSDQTYNPNTLLECFNDIRTEMQQFTERTDRYVNGKNNKNKKRIVLYNMSMQCSSNLAKLIKNRDIISFYFTKGDGYSNNIWDILYGMRSIHALDIVTSGQQASNALIIFFASYKKNPKSKKGAAIKAHSNTGIDSIDSSKNKAHPALTIT
ncbi:hypothetical protein NEOKW01_2159, partial [Nematocida sp. AWRm80]